MLWLLLYLTVCHFDMRPLSAWLQEIPVEEAATPIQTPAEL